MGSAVNQSPGGCNCPGCVAVFESHSPLGQVMLAPAATVSVWRDNTKAEFLGGGSVDANGQIALNVGGVGNVYLEATAPRYQAYSGTLNVPTCGATVPFYMAVDSNYVGVAIGAGMACRYPLPKTLHFSASNGESGTFSYTGPSGTREIWSGTIPTSYAGTGTCTAGTISVNYQLSVSGPNYSGAPTVQRTHKYKIFALQFCPDDAGPQTATASPVVDASSECNPLYLKIVKPSFDQYPWASLTVEVTE